MFNILGTLYTKLYNQRIMADQQGLRLVTAIPRMEQCGHRMKTGGEPPCNKKQHCTRKHAQLTGLAQSMQKSCNHHANHRGNTLHAVCMLHVVKPTKNGIYGIWNTEHMCTPDVTCLTNQRFPALQLCAAQQQAIRPWHAVIVVSLLMARTPGVSDNRFQSTTAHKKMSSGILAFGRAGPQSSDKSLQYPTMHNWPSQCLQWHSTSQVE
mmetsp:Transcript_44794/g.73079  ORF Transcript_44794/g.73079 Transcript_44794/m.73079 type:complete len:209 (-) Transcript_44794:1285-1911(-)